MCTLKKGVVKNILQMIIKLCKTKPFETEITVQKIAYFAVIENSKGEEIY